MRKNSIKEYCERCRAQKKVEDTVEETACRVVKIARTVSEICYKMLLRRSFFAMEGINNVVELLFFEGIYRVNDPGSICLLSVF